MADNRIDIVLQARDNASAALTGYRRNVKEAEDATRKAGLAMEEATGASRGFGTSLGVGGAALGVYTVAAYAAGAGVRAMIATTLEAAATQAKYNQAVVAFDSAPMRADLKKTSDQMEEMRLRGQGWIGWFSNVFQKMKEDHGLATSATTAHARALEHLGKVLPLENMEAMSKGLADINRVQQALAQLDAQRATGLGRLRDYTAAQNALVDAIKREAEEERQQIRIGVEKRIGAATREGSLAEEGPYIKAQSDMAQAVVNDRERARLRAVQQATTAGQEQLRVRESLYARNQAATVGDLATGDEAGALFGPAAQNQVRQLLQEIEEQATQRLLVLIRNEGQTRGEDAVTDYSEPVFGPKAAATGQQLINDLKQQELDLEASKAEIAAQSAGLDQAELARLQLISIEMRLHAQLEDEKLTKSQKALAVFEAQARQQAILRAEAERTQVIPGLDRGLRDVVAEYGSIGLLMQSMTRSMAGGMAGAFSDGFLAPVMAQLKGLPPFMQQIAGSMMRALADEMGKFVTSQIFGSVRNLLSGGMRAVLPVGLSAGLAVGPTTADLLPPVGSTGTVMTPAGRYLSATDVSTAYRQGGDTGVRTLAAGRATVAGDQYLADISPEFTQSPYMQAQTSPSLFQRSLPVAGNAAALGLTAYGANQNTSVPGIFVSGALGGLAGAGLGASLAQSFPSLGLSSSTGAAGGAIAGAAITATLAALAQQQAAKDAAKARQAAEVQRAAGAGGDLLSAAQGARSLPELHDIITQFGSGYTGGRTNPAVSTSVLTPEGRKAIGAPGSVLPTASLADLMANPESLEVGIQAGVDPSQLAGPNAATSAGLKAITKNLLDQYERQAQNVGVSEQEILPTADGGLRRRTEVPATLASRFQGRDFNVEDAGLRGLDDATVATLYSQLVRYDRDQGFQRIVRDDNDMILSVTLAVPPVLPPTPPVQTTPPPAPPAAPPGGPSTGQLLTVGGALTLGVAASLADPASLLNQLLPAGYTGPELFTALQNLITTGSLAGSAGAVTTADLTAQGFEAYEIAATGGTAAAGTALSPFGTLLAGLGGAGGVLQLLQGAQTGDPISIVQGLVSIYSAAATITNAAIGGATPFLPTAGTLLSQAASALGITTTTASAGTGTGAAAGAGAGLAAAAPLLGIAAFAVAAYLMDSIYYGGQQAAAQASAARTFQKLVSSIPGHIAAFQRVPTIVARLQRPGVTPQEAAQIHAELTKIERDFHNSGMEDFLQFGATGAFGTDTPAFLSFPQGPAILNFLRPYGHALTYGLLLAQDIALRGGAAVAAPQSAESFAVSLGGPIFQTTFRPGIEQWTLNGDPNGIPQTRITTGDFSARDPAELATPGDLRVVGIEPTPDIMARQITVQDLINYTAPGGAGLGFMETQRTPEGYDVTLRRALQALQPGHYEEGLRILLAAYGSDNPFFNLPIPADAAAQAEANKALFPMYAGYNYTPLPVYAHRLFGGGDEGPSDSEGAAAAASGASAGTGSGPTGGPAF